MYAGTNRNGYPAAIIWDLDGTLIDSAPDIARALNAVMNEQGQWGHNIESVRGMIGGGVAMLIERAFRDCDSAALSVDRDALVARFLEIYRSCATDSTRLVTAAREVLGHFYHAGVRQGICTNKPRDISRQILDALDISGYFDSVVGGDTTARKKPHPLPLQTCLEQLGVSPERSIMIGDSAADVGAARATGIPVILVPDGYTGTPVEALGPDWILKELADLPGEIHQLQPVQKIA
jgi:phosphoglycolate phosphatase